MNSSKNTNKTINKWGVLASTLIGSFMIVLNSSLMNVALPFFMTLYQIDAVLGQWVITSFAIGMVISMPLTSYLGKRYGKKKLFLIGTFIFLIGSLAGGFAWNFISLILFRLVQGLGGGLVMPLAMILVFEHFSKRERGFAMGIWGIAVMVAPAIGPTIGGIVIEWFSWELLFFINLPIVMISASLAVFFLQKDEVQVNVNFDWWGFLFISYSLITFMSGFTLLQTYYTEIWIYILIGSGVVSSALFLWQELRCEEPLLNIRILNNIVFSSSLIIVCFNVIGTFSILLLVPILVQDVYGYSALLAGLILLPQAIMKGIAMTIGGRILDKQYPYIVMMSGIILLSLSTLFIAYLVGNFSIIWFVLTLIIQGIGNGMIHTPVSTIGLNALKEEHVPEGATFNNIARQIMKIVCVVFLSIFFEFRRTLHLEEYDRRSAGEIAMQESYLLVGVLLLSVIPLVYFLKNKW